MFQFCYNGNSLKSLIIWKWERVQIFELTFPKHLSFRGKALVIVELYHKVYLSRFKFTLYKHMHTHKHKNTNTNVHTHMAGWNGLNSNSIFYTVLFSLPNN